MPKLKAWEAHQCLLKGCNYSGKRYNLKVHLTRKNHPYVKFCDKLKTPLNEEEWEECRAYYTDDGAKPKFIYDQECRELQGNSTKVL